MKRALLCGLTVVCFMITMGAMTARADQLTLGDTCSGSMSLTAGTPGSWGGSVSSCLGFFEKGGSIVSTGTWSLTVTGATTATFSYSGTGGNSLAGTLNLTSVFSGSCLGTACGTITVTSSSGAMSEYAVRGVYPFDITFAFNASTCNGDTFSSCVPSSGQVPVPEPGTLALFGTGLLSMAGFVRRKFLKV